MTVIYDASSPMKCLFSWKGTIFPFVFKRGEFYFFLIYHIVLFSLVNAYVVKHKPEVLVDIRMPSSLIGAAGSLLTFFMVFYLGQCYGRYLALYRDVCKITGNIIDYMGKASVLINDENFERKWHACRYVVASAYIQFFAMTGGEMDEEEWDEILTKELLNKDEVDYLKAWTGSKSFLLQTWSLQEFRDGFLATKSPAPWFGGVMKTIEDIRDASADIVNQIKDPIPFPYFHILNLLMMIVFTLLGWSLATDITCSGSGDTLKCPQKTGAAVFVYFVTLVIFIGMREVAIAFSDPFGDDDVDFEVPKFLASIHGGAFAHLTVPYKPGLQTNEPGGTEPKPMWENAQNKSIQLKTSIRHSTHSHLPTAGVSAIELGKKGDSQGLTAADKV